jgi:hypothetical protein
LIANGLSGLLALLKREQEPWIRPLGVAVSVLLVAPFAYSAWVYFDPAQYRVFGSQPDYRGVAQYLSETAHPNDLILVADEPALGATVLGYYWHGTPPAPLFDARDPRLPTTVSGSVYLVVSFFQNDSAFLDKLSVLTNGWQSAHRFERVTVLQAQTRDTMAALDHIVSLLASENARFQPVLTLLGSISQLRGTASDAVQEYQAAGEYFDTGDEYFRTAEGYLQRGDPNRAWREALISKFMRPANAPLHTWLSSLLQAEGYSNQSAMESQIANRLGER